MRHRILNMTLIVSLVLLANLTSHAQDKTEAVFSRPTVEIGFVVSDLEKSAKFYTDVVGMTEIKGFTAPAEMATKFGLTDGLAIKVRKFALADAKD